MNITMFHEIDTGFMAATLKPAFERLGHTCTIIQCWKTHIENNTDHIDYLLSESDEDIEVLKEIYENTDYFIIRAGDITMKDTAIVPYLNKHNMVYRLHGHDLTHLNRPYSLKTWCINWHNKEPFTATYNDPTFIGLLTGNVAYIERPINLDIIPKRKRTREHFALNSPTNVTKKGAEKLYKAWDKCEIPLKIISNTTRDEVLELKSRCSYFIDNLSYDYDGGPYGMNSVEAWLMGIPVFSRYNPISEVVCPELPRLVTNITLENVQQKILEHVTDRKQLNYARKYALRTHDPIVIAKQYLALAEHIKEREQ